MIETKRVPKLPVVVADELPVVYYSIPEEGEIIEAPCVHDGGLVSKETWYGKDGLSMLESGCPECQQTVERTILFQGRPLFRPDGKI